MRSNRTLIFLLTIALLLTTACNSDPDLEHGGATVTPIPAGLEVEQPTYTVQRGEVVHEISFTARIAPVREEKLFFRADGFLDRVAVQRNQDVNAGDLLAELERAELQRQLDAALLDLQEAEISAQQSISRTLLSVQDAELALARARSSRPDPNILQAQFALTRSLATLQYAQDEYNKALNRPWETQDSLDAYASQVTEAQRSLAVSQATYDAALSERQFNIQQMEIDLSRAQLEYQAAAGGVDPRLRQKVEQLEAQVAERQIVAPIDGVLTSIAAAPGDRITAFNTVIVVGDLSALEAQAELTSDQVRDMQIGQQVVLVQTNLPGATAFSGEVRQLPFGLGGEVQEVDRAVHITLASGAPALGPGALVQARIVLERKADALWLPPGAIQTFQGREFVIVQEADGAQRRVDVLSGIASADRVEIVSGLEEGQVVVGQ